MKEKEQLDLKDLIKEVNKADKIWGLNLKDPELWADPENYFEIMSARADMNIAALICCLNGIDIKDYFVTDTSGEFGYSTICRPVGILNPSFTNDSFLQWTNLKKTYDINSLTFKCRFLTVFLSSFMGSTENIIKREVKRKNSFFAHSKDEQKIVLLKETIDDLLKLINIMLYGSSYKNIILKNLETLSYIKKGCEQDNLKNLLNGHIINVRNGLKKVVGIKSMDDDIAIYQLLKIAYMLTSNKTTVGKVVPFVYIEGATAKHDLSKLIEDLGRVVLEDVKSKKYSPGFKAYIYARPKVQSQLHKQTRSNENLRMGILALSYTSFIINDKDVSSFIKEMMKKGI